MRSRLAAFAVTALVLTLGLPAAGAQARPFPPAPPNYLAAGDSITQGLGVTPVHSYPSLVDARSRHLTLAANLAVKGATVADVATQLGTFAAADPAAAARITRISLTVGANDVGWVQALLTCLNLPVGVQCAELVDPASQLKVKDLVDAGLGGLAVSLPALLDGIGTMFPNARVYVGSYYELFGSRHRECVVVPASGVSPGYSISLVNKTWYNQTTRRLNAVIRDAVRAADATPVGTPVRFVNVAPRFNGHGFCDSARRWVIGPQDLLTGSSLDAVAHPNARGQRAYATAFAAKGVR
ncbi:MAG: SGNH/GDSL hydrolase family protein [Propionibacteriaceae bacterium]|nr:SGNH/GDSL hydrolase family protein [Propionibacteriaceae bacterium]